MATIFDCDGTLVDSEGLANEVLVSFVAEFGLRISHEFALRHFRGIKLATSVELLEAKLGRALPETFVPEFRRRMSVAFGDRLKPINGARELVLAAAPPVCVASSGPLEKIRLSLEVTGLDSIFENRIFSSYQIQSWKPEPDLFIHAAKSMGVSPQACNVVEDSLPGIAAGIAAGMRVFAFQPLGRDPAIPSAVLSVSQLSDLKPMLS